MLRAIIIIGLASLVIGLTLPNVWLPGPIGGNLPISVNDRYDIVSIVPGSIADAAGLRVGDHIEPRSLSVAGRLALQAYYLLRLGESMRFTVDRNGRSFPVELREPRHANVHSTSLAIVKRTTATLFIVVATALLLVRPSTMLWGFFLYALGSAGGSPLILEWASPLLMAVATVFLVAIVYVIMAPLGLLMFVTRFPASSPTGWRKLVKKWTPALAALLALPATAFVLVVLGVSLPPETDAVSNGITVGVVTIGIVTLLAGFVHADAPQRQRLRWVVAGFAIYYAAVIYQLLSVYFPAQGWPPAWSNAGWTSDVLNALVIFIPITVAYAVLKHHVLDLNFVIGRGLVYAILTSIAVATFAVIGWLIGSVLAQTKLATAGEIAAAVAIGFWMNGLEHRVDRFVDAVIFRRRHLAERRLARVAAGLPHAETYDSVAAMLVREPVAALGLLSAAFFRRTDEGRFDCQLAVGSEATARVRLDAGDVLGIHLKGERGPVLLHGIDWKMPDLPDGPSMPVIAMPIFVRHDLHGIVFYGGHVTGEAIDPDEVRVLESLCVSAGAALDHLEAKELRRRLDDSQRVLALMTQEVQALRTATATTGS